MPFTLSHVAVAAPLARRGLVFSALVAGSIAPDLEYFLRLTTQSQWAHSFPGALLFPFPAALVALGCFHAFLKRPLLALLPAAQRRVLEPYAGPFAFRPARRAACVAFSLALGVGLHLLLDSVTHDYGLVARHCAWLQKPLFHSMPRNLLVCDALQVLASAGMLLILAAQYVRLFAGEQGVFRLRAAQSKDYRQIAFAYALITLAAVAAGLAFAHAHVPRIESLHGVRRFMGFAVVAGIDTAFLGAVLAGHVLLRARLRDEPAALAAKKEDIRE
jgi:membrane-bound metal-dependent hydrolase YbcI (DUF457 family)